MDGLSRALHEIVTDEHDEAPCPEPRRIARRAISVAVVAIGLIYGLYLVGMNVFLSTSLFARVVNSDPVTLEIHFTHGWSLFPTRVHARDLDIRSSDSNVEWTLHLDEVEFELSLLSIPRRRFEIAHARGRGVSLRARQKLDAMPASPEEVAMLPPVPGFPAYSVRPAGPPSLERWFDEHYELIRVRLDDVAADDVREVWVDDARFQGSARVTGRFFLHPIRAVDVGPVHVEIRSGSVTAGSTLPIAHDISGVVDAAIDRFDPRETPLASILRYVSGATDLRASFADAQTLPLPRPDGLAIQGAMDAPKVAVRMRRGVLGAGTEIRLGVDKAVVSDPDVSYGARVEATGAIDTEGDPLRVALALSDVELRLGKRPPIVHVPRLDVSLETRQLDLTDDPFRDVSGELRTKDIIVRPGKRELEVRGGMSSRFIVRGWRSGTEAIVVDEADADLVGVSVRRTGVKEPLASVERAGMKLRKASFRPEDLLATVRADVSVAVEGGVLRDPVFLDAVPESTRLHVAGDGAFAVTSNLHVERRVLHGHVTMRTRGLGVRSEPLTVWGDTSVDLDIARWALTTATLSLGPSRVALTHGSAVLGAPAARPRDVSIQRVELEGRAKDLNLTSPALSGVEGRLTFEGVEVPDVRGLQRVMPATTNLRVASGKARASGRLEVSTPQAGAGYVVLDLEDGAVTIGKAHVQGNVQMRVAVRSFDARTSTFDLSGSRVTLDKVEIRGLGIDATNWRGEAILHESSLRFDSPDVVNRLDSVVRFDADDARPILAAVLRGAAPKFLADFVKMPRLAAWGRLSLSPDALLLSDVDASGGDVALRGCYGIHGDVKEGAFVVEKGLLSVGVGVEPDGDAYPRFFGLDGWLAAHTRDIKARTVAKAKAAAK